MGFQFKDQLWPVMVYGYNLSSDFLGPWEITEGNEKDLKNDNTVFLDESLIKNVPGIELNDIVKINDVELKVVGFSKNTKWFMNPFVFISIENARSALFMENRSSLFAIQLKNGCTYEEFSQDVEDSGIKGVEVFTSGELRENTRNFMIFKSGMDVGVGSMVVMGFFVGMCIVTLTMYSSVKDKIPEFGTLKALGARKSFIIKMLTGQAFIICSISYFLGLGLTALIGTFLMSASTMPIHINLIWTVMLYALMIGLGVIAALIAARKVHKIDPAIVFRA